MSKLATFDKPGPAEKKPNNSEGLTAVQHDNKEYTITKAALTIAELGLLAHHITLQAALDCLLHDAAKGETLYLSRSTTHLNEVVSQAFAGGSRAPPGANEGVAIARASLQGHVLAMKEAAVHASKAQEHDNKAVSDAQPAAQGLHLIAQAVWQPGVVVNHGHTYTNVLVNHC
ncbi:hypothetical protein CY34DRAFT_12807 [Suillus luteus UH-Slu-Lm8-n1]|uniref:Uncharacterized protein n=1 Tax=Suillus luteus UH-Slu-Lm8-n1 TaxID=930992 RepID=A0A0D0APS4_9AGAM|nr:hypothetical protein CY34DRAFT_18050 [Suillus luteus UH-Slu-Lm8-n1]KIK41774.1 hypothetical protein CY34DRAFT_12807 [Suillus luteus UH-Slu-Lm8-n1]